MAGFAGYPYSPAPEHAVPHGCYRAAQTEFSRPMAHDAARYGLLSGKRNPCLSGRKLAWQICGVYREFPMILLCAKEQLQSGDE
ncbi:MAG: hypothetical protein LAT78_14000, partial [Roseinatronobacter sp.]|nr:hypothetical protein [Roseinatronobacter sp.]